MSLRYPMRAGALLLCGGVLLAVLLRGDAADEPQRRVQGRNFASLVTTATLGGPDRYLTHLSTDKPIYRVGEMVRVRGVVLHHATRRPLPGAAQARTLVEIKGPKGEVAASGYVDLHDSVLGFQWTIPASQAGGEYLIRVSHPFAGHAPAERHFDIRAYRAPRLKTQIKFLRDGYGPGDEVVATLHAERAEGGVPAGATVTAIARVDGSEVARQPTTIDSLGDCIARFKLPAQITRGEGTLALAIEDGGVVETASKTIPILLQTVDLTIYPEGGDLVAGFLNRVYFEAFTPAKKPADLAGEVVDADGHKVASFRSDHEGRGRFSILPRAGVKYALRITEPSGIRTEYALPAVQESGVVLRADRDVFSSGDPIVVSVGCRPADRKLRVTLAKREQIVATNEVRIPGDKAETLVPVTLRLSDQTADGVLTATVWDADGRPLAERLIFRQPATSLQVKIIADANPYLPAGRARLTVQTTDPTGKPISAVVGLTVTDDSVLEMIERREQAPRLPVMALLENEVRELADAHVYLDAADPRAPLAVDLLLATQGWRRFAVVAVPEFLREHGDAARRALALRLVAPQEWGRGGGMGGLAGRLWFDDAGDAFGAVPQAMPAGPVPVPDDAPRPVAGVAPVPPPAAALPVAEPPAAAEKPAMPAARAEVQAELGQALELAEGKRERLLGDLAKSLAVRNDFVVVRMYAHQVRRDRQPGERTDFTETLFWHAAVRTSPQGEAMVEFTLNDAVSSFRVFADAFSDAGALGHGTLQIDSVEPFYLEPKLPLEVTTGDVVQAPLGVVNGTGTALEGVRVQVQSAAAHALDADFPPWTLAPSERARKLLGIRVGQSLGPADFIVSANAGPYRDQVTRSLLVKPAGFPIEDARGGLLQPGNTASHEIVVPEDVVAGSLHSRCVVYPTPLASLTEALERLIQEPYGCFEQTSSTTYPLVMAQQYFLSHQHVDPALVERSRRILAQGYERLLGFECKSGGFEWFGNDPGHDALTAYGLLEFTDMARVRPVDAAMLARTRQWLLAQRDGQGGYARKTHTLHTWLAEPEVAYTYDTWALLEAGVDADLTRELAWVREAADRSANTYVVALAANVLALAGDQDGANRLLDRLSGKQTEDGSLKDAVTSVIGSGGEALTIETTALAVLAWLKNPRYADSVERSIKYLAECCKGGRFGSTQSTILTLRAIVAYDQSRARPKAPGSVRLLVDGQPVGEPVAFTAETQGAIQLPDAATCLAPGKHQVQIQMTDGSQMPYSVAVKYHRLTPASSAACKLHLAVSLQDQPIDEGSVTEATVVVINRTGQAVPTPVAIIGVPGGLEVRHDQLKELVKAGKVDAYEVLGREVVLYWRALNAEERVDVSLSLVAAIPGTYTAPASRAYLYYTDEHKHWVEGVKVKVVPKRART